MASPKKAAEKAEAVKRLLAIREVALAGGDRVKVADVDARLAELGYAV